MSTILEKIKCKFGGHPNNEVICWAWCRDYNHKGQLRSFIKADMKCLKCGKRHYVIIDDALECRRFIDSHKGKRVVNV